MAQLEQALMEAHKQNQELQSGVQETQMKIQASTQESQAKMQMLMHEKQAELQLKQQELQAQQAMDQQKMQEEANIAIFKAKLEAETKVTVAEIAAKGSLSESLIQAELQANTELSKTLGAETPIKKLTDMHSQQLDVANKHTEVLAKIGDVLGQQMDLHKQALAAAGKPRKLTLQRDANGRPIGGRVN